MEIKFTLHGIEDLRRVLNSMPREMEGEALTDALRAGARVIVKEAKARAPVRSDALAKPISSGQTATKGRLAGYLRASIGTRAIGGRKGARVVVTVGKAFYGMFQEFGTRFQPARPWLRPAFDAAGPVALKAIMGSMSKSIEKAATKLARRSRRR